MEPIARESLDELKVIFSWVKERESSLTEPITVLVGGWAVYCYNNYWGSVDIDLITNNTTKKSLKRYLVLERGYQKDIDSSNSVFKRTVNGDVVIDLANRGSDRFEGSMEKLELSIVDGLIEDRPLEDQEVTVPARSVLLMMKFKAAWDRCWRLDNGKSGDPSRDMNKMIKDHSDILALLDPKKGGKDVDIMLMGDYFSRYPFTKKVFDDLIESKNAAEKYGIDRREGIEIMERFRRLVVF